MAELHHGTTLTPSKVDLVAAWMGGQRWYAAKGTTPALSRLTAWRLGDPVGQVGIETLILLDTAGPEPVVYQVPLTYRDAPVEGLEHALVGTMEHGVLGTRWVYDAPHDPVYAAQVLALLQGRVQAESSARSDAVDDRFVGEPAATWQGEVTVTTAKVLAGEQSNTSVILETIDRPVIVKIFRTLAHGENPDVVLQTALRSAGCERVPDVVGAVRGAWPTVSPDGVDDPGTIPEAHGHLAFAQEFLPGVEDAWRVALGSVESGDDFTRPARDLGAATAEVHGALADALGTTPMTPEEGQRVVAGMRARLDAAMAAAPDLAEHRSATLSLIEAALDGDWPARQRIHGDYHLGQVLHSPERGWILLDFEGEPLRPLAERVEPDHWLRDVAGMLRSFDYAGGSWEQDNPGSARTWVEQTREAFLDGYAAGAGHDPRREHPALLAAFEADKAMYEVVYEARHRPGWIGIPVDAVERLVRAHTRPTPAGDTRTDSGDITPTGSPTPTTDREDLS